MKTKNEKELSQQLDEIYEAVVGDNGRERFTHEELIEVILDMYDNAVDVYRKKYISDNIRLLCGEA